MSLLFPALHTATSQPALRFGDRSLDYRQLAAAASNLASRVGPTGRVAVWATPTLETCVGVVAALLAGVPVVPVDPGADARELAHIVADSAPSLVLAEPGTELPDALTHTARADIVIAPDADEAVWSMPPEPVADSAALIIYTTGAVGPPKGVVLSRRALASNLDDLRDAWDWTADDVLVHALPLSHVHGLVLGVLGPLRAGGSVRHLRTSTPEGVARELAAGGTVLFGEAPMYHELAEAVRTDPEAAGGLSAARLLVSGPGPLSRQDEERISAAGTAVVERYGTPETLVATSTRPGLPRPGTVGTPLHHIDVRVVTEAGQRIAPGAEQAGELQVRGPSLFTEYLNRPDATAEAFDGGWFRTGDMATLDAEGNIRLLGHSTKL